MDDQDPIESEPLTPAPTTLALRDPRVPATLDDLAALRGQAIEVVETRATVLETLRKRGIRLTVPEDWLLFRNAQGRITGYLSDAGAGRLRDLIGIEVFDVEEPRRLMAGDGQSFMYVQRASGRAKTTGQVVEKVEGGRASTEDFCKDDTGAVLDLKVKKACRANVNGSIVRELAGLKNVSEDDLREAWKGTGKDLAHANRGRGFGTQDERLGAARAGTPDVPPPTCPHCQTPATLRQGRGGKGAFYGCRHWDKAGHPKWTLDLEKWLAQAKASPADGPTPEDVAADNRLDAEIAARDARGAK